MAERVRVLIVDDSAFFRKRIRQQLGAHADIIIAGEAANGREAVEMTARLHPDVVTMDVAMPEMDGISAVREIMRTHPTNVLMVSALTSEGARATLDALDAGAVDFLPKPLGQNGGTTNSDQSLVDRIIGIAAGRRRARQANGNNQHAAVPLPRSSAAWSMARPARTSLVAIGASTGGPVAIQRVLAALPVGYPHPVLVAVHMPAEFTATFAERLDSICSIDVALAKDGMPLQKGKALIAPGGCQTLVKRRGQQFVVAVTPGGQHLYKPSVDLTFSSVASAAGDGALAVVLTGMGADGTEGARALKQAGSSVWSQDQASSVVFGMPYSVAKSGLTDRVLALDDIGPALAGLG
ncbi:MAG: chemotaxis response regulator protein-glutamate methylesterase [Gammaproteobacteria bacterium]|nr:chemotaxis response regulator protein-glutamate methylesterase [Gammaproteobacteria bacterium]